MLVSKALIVSAGLLLLGAAGAVAQTTTFTSGSPGINTTSITVGSDTFTSGTVNGQHMSSTSITIGGDTFTSGMIGGHPYSTTTIGPVAPVVPPITTP